jgi:hypothetical protein
MTELPLQRLIDIGLDSSTRAAEAYVQSQKSVYPVAGRVVAKLLGIDSNESPVQLLADVMSVMRYANDMIDIYAVPESEFLAAVSNPISFPALREIIDRVACSGDLVAFIQAVKYLLAASAVQRSCSSRFYANARAAEGEAAGKVLVFSVSRFLPDGRRGQSLSRLTVEIATASNLWDTLWDLREDHRFATAVLSRTLVSLIASLCRLLTSGHVVEVTRSLSMLTRRYYLSSSARKKWSSTSRREAWLAYRKVHGI